MSVVEKIYALPSFKRQYQRVVKESVASSFPELHYEKEIGEVDWSNLISCASILQTSNSFIHLDAALRIAQSALLSQTSELQHKIAATVILESLTNKPAIQLALKRNLIPKNYQQSIPFTMQMEAISRDFNFSIVDKKGELIFLNKFQKVVYDESLEFDLLSISAPTSAGKSFILSQILLEKIQTPRTTIVYLVPTRALISQVEEDIRLLVTHYALDKVFISSVPQKVDEEFNEHSKVLVFTQERLHWFRSESPEQYIDFVIVDEAQKIEDGNRGILLQQKIEDLVASFPNIKIFFSSPYTSNPEILFEGLSGNRKSKPIKTEFISVNQNLIYLTQKRGRPTEWELTLCTKDEYIYLGQIQLANRPIGDPKRLVFVAQEMSDKDGGNMIYANGAALAEKYSNILYDSLPDSYKAISNSLQELIELVKRIVHPKYLLAKALSKKIAFHYGNMPLTVRQEIERLFKSGDIHYIICTSTLLEGVNLPAKSIFMRKPTRGSGNPMNQTDFWNLAGRAGRWGKEFQGNIVCIDPDKWEIKPSINREKQVIKKAVDDIVSKEEELIQFIKNGSPRSVAKNNQELESAFCYFFIKYLQGNTAVGNTKTNQLYHRLQEEFKPIVKTLTVPHAIIFRNPTISPIAQQRLLEHFEYSIGSKEDLIFDLPESENAVDNSYKPIIAVINRILSGDPEELAPYHSVLIVNWMRGFPLRLLIDNSFAYWKRRGKPKTIDDVIRKTMSDVEEFVRFKFSKFSGCYIDILRHYFRTIGREDLNERIPNIHIWLEFGVSQQTQLSLISLGLSRNSAIAVSELIAKNNLDRKAVLEWFAKNDPSSLQLSPIIVSEIERMIG